MTVFKYHERPWRDLTADYGAPSGGRLTKVVVEGECGFFVSSSTLAAGTRIEPHSHTADELMVVLEGGCTLDDGQQVAADDWVVVPAGQVYGFTVGGDGMRFAVVRNEKAMLEWAEPEAGAQTPG
jgi:quercetin dioxygenase-like cupin family protein